MENEKKQPSGYCMECGISANVLTCLMAFGQRPKQLAYTVSTFHTGICAACGEEKDVTEARDFFYPDFELLKRKRIYIKQ